MPAISEATFLRQVVELANAYGWWVHHVENSTRLARRRSGLLVRVRNVVGQNGAPDLLLVRERVLFRELKTNVGRLTPEQKAWGERIARAGGDFDVWRPRDHEHVERVLR